MPHTERWQWGTKETFLTRHVKEERKKMKVESSGQREGAGEVDNSLQEEVVYLWNMDFYLFSLVQSDRICQFLAGLL